MSSRRQLKAAEAIREVVSTAILLELRDPRVQDVTVTGVEVAPDMRTAKVHVSIMGDDKKQELCLHGLRSASGFLQQRVGSRIDTRYIPRLRFVLDRGVKNAIAVARILKEVLPPEESTEQAQSMEEPDIGQPSDTGENSSERRAEKPEKPPDSGG